LSHDEVPADVGRHDWDYVTDPVFARVLDRALRGML
jgi:hypothetical protein